LRDEGALFARALEGAGVPVRHFSHAGMIHHFYSLGAVIPASQAALASIGVELREAFAGATVNQHQKARNGSRRCCPALTCAIHSTGRSSCPASTARVRDPLQKQ
jgi:hypothetical protein